MSQHIASIYHSAGHLLKKATLPQDHMKNYRPVSGLSFLSRLVESVVAKQLNNHVEENGLGNKMQSAYRPGYSTETALLAIKNNIHLGMSNHLSYLDNHVLDLLV